MGCQSWVSCFFGGGACRVALTNCALRCKANCEWMPPLSSPHPDAHLRAAATHLSPNSCHYRLSLLHIGAHFHNWWRDLRLLLVRFRCWSLCVTGFFFYNLGENLMGWSLNFCWCWFGCLKKKQWKTYCENVKKKTKISEGSERKCPIGKTKEKICRRVKKDGKFKFLKFKK